MTLANKVTIARVLLVPLFVILVLYHRTTGDEWQRWGALSVFAAAALSDALDGWLARRFHQFSRLGSILDPVADKILLVTALLLLSRGGVSRLEPLPLWLVAIILSRDAVLALGLGVLYFTFGTVSIRPHWTGKVSTALQMVIILLTLLEILSPLRWGLALLAVAAALFSALAYIRLGIQQLNASPHSGPEPSARG